MRSRSGRRDTLPPLEPDNRIKRNARIPQGLGEKEQGTPRLESDIIVQIGKQAMNQVGRLTSRSGIARHPREDRGKKQRSFRVPFLLQSARQFESFDIPSLERKFLREKETERRERSFLLPEIGIELVEERRIPAIHRPLQDFHPVFQIPLFVEKNHEGHGGQLRHGRFPGQLHEFTQGLDPFRFQLPGRRGQLPGFP